MSNVGLSMAENSSGGPRPPRRPKQKKKRTGTAIVVAIVVVVGLIAAVGYGGFMVLQRLESSQPAADYPGEGSGKVVVEVEKGQTLADIGTTLQQKDVVASVQAFTDAALVEEEATNITPGRYKMAAQMSGAAAVQALLDPASRHLNTIVLPEGMRTYETVEVLSDVTGISESQFFTLIESPNRLPYPDWNEGSGKARGEGFLFPATYEFDKDATAEEILTTIVNRFNEVATELNFEEESKKTGFTPYEALTVASLLQAEALPEDFDKVSRVVYNRLDEKTWGGTYGYLGFDSTLNYGLRLDGVIIPQEINIPNDKRTYKSPYNTFTEQNQGLPPTPIQNPGKAAMESALNPADGDWLYFVTTNPDTGKTKFTADYNEFIGYSNEFEAWLRRNQ